MRKYTLGSLFLALYFELFLCIFFSNGGVYINLSLP